MSRYDEIVALHAEQLEKEHLFRAEAIRDIMYDRAHEGDAEAERAAVRMLSDFRNFKRDRGYWGTMPV